jgi:hypothetical protein
MLQVSSPHRGKSKVQLVSEAEHSSEKHVARATPSKGHSTHGSHDPHHHAHSTPWSHPQRTIGSTSALSFIQTAESVRETTKVTESSGQDMPIKVESSRPVKLPGGDEAHSAWRRGFADAAILVSAIFLLAWSFIWMSRSCFIRFGYLAKARSAKTVELPQPQPAREPEELLTWTFKEPLLEKTGVSFAIPLTQYIEHGNTKVFSFNIARRPAGPPISATVTCKPEGSILAKVELIAGIAGGVIPAPLCSCRLVNSVPDAESRNMQGAMVSWLSLLLHEKTEAVSVQSSSRDDLESAAAGRARDSRVRVCLHGIAEDLLATGFEGGDCSKENNRKLEVLDGMGTSAGHLEPSSQHGQYVLAVKGESVLEIEALPDSRSIQFSQNDEVVAHATRWGFRNPELPELTGEEDEHLQIDIREDATWQDTARLLTCALAMIIFKPKTSTSGKAAGQ